MLLLSVAPSISPALIVLEVLSMVMPVHFFGFKPLLTTIVWSSFAMFMPMRATFNGCHARLIVRVELPSTKWMVKEVNIFLCRPVHVSIEPLKYSSPSHFIVSCWAAIFFKGWHVEGGQGRGNSVVFWQDNYKKQHIELSLFFTR